ncbi:MAG: hypothetical protein KDA89_24330 [Planctomycetaceae bacterium]|nr:hypothetical protein [Planctomycetaceae bacterium]
MPVASSADLYVVGGYLILVTALGCLMSTRTHTAREFIAAGGSLPGWVVGLSIIGTFVSSISFIAHPGKTYSGTWNPFVFSLSLPYAAWVSTRYFVSWFRNSGSLSAYEYLEICFGSWARLYAAGFNILYHIGRIGAILFGVSLAVSALIQVPVPVIIVVLGVLVIAYTLVGGIEAVIWTDVLQSIILVGGMLLCAGVLLMKVPGGFAGVVHGAQTPEMNKLSLGSMDLSFATSTFWTMLVFGFFINLQNFAADQTFVQRYFTARSEGEAVRSVWMGALAYLPISAVLFFIGTGLYVFYGTNGALPEGTPADRVLPHFIMNELPTGASGLLIAAILAAAMSTVDSSLNSSATLMLCDIRNRFFRSAGDEPSKDASAPGDNPYRSPTELRQQDQGELRFLRLMTILIGIAGVGAALAMIGVQQMLDMWWQLSGILSGGTLGLMLLARFTRVRGPRAAAAGVMTGITTILIITLAHQTDPAVWLTPVVTACAPVRNYFDPLMAIVAGTFMVTAVAWLASFLTGERSH